jgi:DNA-binding transcriptional MocR family regulator
VSNLEELKQAYAEVQSRGLALNMQRGQPSDNDFDLANPMLTIVDETDLVTPSGVAIRNYPGGVYGLPEARELFATVLDVKPAEMIVGNNASLRLMATTWMWAMLRGLKESSGPWVGQSPKVIVTVPGYDRHFKLLDWLGFDLIAVDMLPEGPDVEEIAAIAGGDPSVKGLVFVPTYSNPTGQTISDAYVRRLASMETAAPDFTIFADDAYAVHHLTDQPEKALNLVRACEEAGNPDRAYLYGSTSKITFASGGIGFMASSEANVQYLGGLLGAMSIGPNKVEQYRHVKFITGYPGGLAGLMADHAKILGPKFAAVQEVLERELGGSGLATWTDPKGGYFVSLDTDRPVADRVVELAKGAGVALTPAGATYPYLQDPHNRNIRLSPSRPPAEEVAAAMEVVALCVKLASAEYDAAN